MSLKDFAPAIHAVLTRTAAGDVSLPREISQAIYEEVMLNGILEDLKRIHEVGDVLGLPVSDDIGELRQRVRDALGVRRDLLDKGRP